MASMEKLIRIRLQMIDNISKPLKGIANDLENLSSSLTKAGTAMTAGLTVPLVAIGAQAVEAAGKFEQSLANIRSITGQTAEETAALGDYFMQLSGDLTKTTDSAQNLALAYYDIASAGYEQADAQKIIEAATKGATAGLTTTKEAAKGLTAILNAYGMTAADVDRINDQMFQTVKIGTEDFAHLNSSIANVVATASTLGVASEEWLAAIATMSQQGHSYSEATTRINQAMLSFIKPSEAMTKAINAAGFASGSAMIEQLGFAGALEEVYRQANGNQEALQAMFGDIRAGSAALALTGSHMAGFVKNIEDVKNSAGATQEAFDIMTDTWEAAVKNLQNVWGNFLIDLGNIIQPMLKPIVEGLAGLLNAFMALPEPAKQVIVVVGTLVAAAGPLLLIFGQIAGAIAAINTALPLLAATLPVIAGGFTALLAPIMPLIVALGLLFLAYQTNFLGIRSIVDSTVGFVVDMLGKAWTSLSQLGALLSKAWTEMNAKATTALQQLWTIVTTALGRLGDIALQIGGEIIKGLVKGVSLGIIGFIKMIQDLANQAVAAVKKAFGIASPSKVMMKIGEQIVGGLHKGIENFGGIGVNVPQAGGSIQSRQPTLAYGGGGGGGGGTVNYYNTFVLPEKTTKEQAKEIDRYLAKEAARRGAKRTK